jgi:DNA polymerase-4
MLMIRIAHIDLTAFFVSVERIIDPSLIGKPIIVAGRAESRGVVTCASYEVRKYGVRAGMATATAERKCPIAIRVDAHYEAYEEYSGKVKSFLRNYAPVLEAASIDEFYLDWSGCEKLFGGNLLQFARRIQKTIKIKFGLPCALGIASNKTTAKITCDQAKPEGVLEISDGREAEFLNLLSVKVLPGVGEVMLEKLNLRGIRTCGQLARMDSATIGRTLGKSGLRIQDSARGHGDPFLITAREQKQISREETFAKDTRDSQFIASLFHEMILTITEELRFLDLKAQCLRVKLRYSDWVETSRQITIPPSHDPPYLTKIVLALYKKADTRRVTVRLIGVGVTQFVHDGFSLDLLRQDEEKREWLLKAVDKINYKYGDHKVKVGCMA